MRIIIHQWISPQSQTQCLLTLMLMMPITLIRDLLDQWHPMCQTMPYKMTCVCVAGGMLDSRIFCRWLKNYHVTPDTWHLLQMLRILWCHCHMVVYLSVLDLSRRTCHSAITSWQPDRSHTQIVQIVSVRLCDMVRRSRRLVVVNQKSLSD